MSFNILPIDMEVIFDKIYRILKHKICSSELLNYELCDEVDEEFFFGRAVRLVKS